MDISHECLTLRLEEVKVYHVSKVIASRDRHHCVRQPSRCLGRTSLCKGYA